MSYMLDHVKALMLHFASLSRTLGNSDLAGVNESISVK